MKGILCFIFTKWKIVLFCRLLQCLDKGTLRLLSENTRIMQFSPDLSSWLLDILDSKNQQVTQVPEIYFFKNNSFLKWKSSCLKWRIQNRGNEKVFHTVIYFIIVVHCTNPSTVIQLMWNYTYTMCICVYLTGWSCIPKVSYWKCVIPSRNWQQEKLPWWQNISLI